MKNLLLLISVGLIMVSATCNTSNQQEANQEQTPDAVQITAQDSVKMPEIGGEPVSEAGNPGEAKKENAAKLGNKGQEKTDSSRIIIQHGSPDQAGIDSVKAAKTKGKFK